MQVETTTLSKPNGRKLTMARSMWWIVFILFATFRFFDLRGMLSLWEGNFFARFFVVVYFALSIVATVLAIFLFWKKSDEWVAILVSMMFISFVQDGYGFWAWLFENVGWPMSGVDMLALVFQFISWGIFLWAFLNFPNGHWIFPRIYWVLIIWAVLFLVPVILDAIHVEAGKFTEILGTTTFVGSLMLVGVLQWIHYFKNLDPVQRQQVKWVIVFFVISIIFDNFITVPAGILVRGSNLLPETVGNYYYLTNGITTILVTGWMTAFSIALFRYRLWDIDLIINKALVYSALTGLLGLIGIASATTIDFFISAAVGEDSSYWSALVSALPVAAAFNPLLKRLQDFVDRRFKPEGVDFSRTFIEFAPEILGKMKTNNLTAILASQIATQLELELAAVFLRQAGGEFICSAYSHGGKQPVFPELDRKRWWMLEGGKLVHLKADKMFELLIPLVVPRANIPELVGVIANGRRRKGKGYSTQTLNNLSALGIEAGRALYTSMLLQKDK